MSSNDPLISVVFPMFNLRGGVSEAVRSWTSEQTLPRDRYSVIVACSNEMQEADVSGLGLVAHDRIVRGPAGSDGALWNAGAAHAVAPWLIFTEGHCRGEPGCLAAVHAWITSGPTAPAGNFAVGHLMRNLQARLSDRWFAQVQEEWRKEWRRLHRAGFVIRSDVFHAATGFEPEYGEFSVPMLSARLAGRGVVVADIPGAAVTHCDDEDMADHHRATESYSRGEAFARSRNDAAFFERYFGHNDAWTNQLVESEGIRRRQVEAALRAAAIPSRSSASLVQDAARRAVSGAAGRLGRAKKLRRLVKLAEFAVEKTALPADVQLRTFLRANARQVEATQLEWVERNALAPAPAAAETAVRPIQHVAPTEIVGVHGLETHNSRLFRWSEPVLTFRGLPERGRELRIQTNSLRGDPARLVRAAFAGGKRLPKDSIRSEDGVLVISIDRMPPDAGEIIVVCHALKPWRRGVNDRRALGLPIFSIETRA
jgi:hypothetical protein